MGTRAVSRLIAAPFSEELVQRTATEMRTELGAPATFAVAFISPGYVPQAENFLELIRLEARVSTVVGCTATGLIGPSTENEHTEGFSLLLVSAPKAKVHSFSFTPDQVEQYDGPAFWSRFTKLNSADVKGWLVFANPYQIPVDPWIRQWNQTYPGLPAFGGLASMNPQENNAYVLHNNKIEEGGVLLALEGDITVKSAVSQGCKPIGEPMTVTGADNNVLITLGSKPAYEVLNGAYQSLSESERERAKGHLFAGLALNEYVDEFKRGDFLVRNILGADPQTGAVAIGARARIGQTLQYQLRDASAASEDLSITLAKTKKSLRQRTPAAGLLCTCLGRGHELFGASHHDAGKVEEFFPGLPLAGFFANGEIGPVGTQNFAHGYTASLILFL